MESPEQSLSIGAGVLFLAFLLVAVTISLVSLGVWIWSLVSVLQNPALDSNARLLWILVIVFAGLIGAIIYLVAGRNGPRSFGQNQPQFAPPGKQF